MALTTFRRLNRIKTKKTITDGAVDGVVPEAALRTPAQAFQDALTWLERLDGGYVEEVLCRKIAVPLRACIPEQSRETTAIGSPTGMVLPTKTQARGQPHSNRTLIL